MNHSTGSWFRDKLFGGDKSEPKPPAAKPEAKPETKPEATQTAPKTKAADDAKADAYKNIIEYWTGKATEVETAAADEKPPTMAAKTINENKDKIKKAENNKLGEAEIKKLLEEAPESAVSKLTNADAVTQALAGAERTTATKVRDYWRKLNLATLYKFLEAIENQDGQEEKKRGLIKEINNKIKRNYSKEEEDAKKNPKYQEWINAVTSQ